MYPALAVVAVLRERADVLWIGGEGGMEAELVPRAGLAFESIPAAGVHGVGIRALPGNAWRLARGVPAARRAIDRFRPDVLFFTGGYVGVPVAMAAGGRPIAAFIPDIEPALALRLISRRADWIAVSTEAGKTSFPARSPVTVTGYPVRASLDALDQGQARALLGLGEGPVLLVFGGSRGARSINEALWAILSEVLPHTQVVHITGRLDWPRLETMTAALDAGLRERYHAFPYLHERMDAALIAADLAVSRAGAATLGEYPAAGLPSILVPYPHAWRYQRVNAAYLAEQGAAVVLRDEELPQRLLPTLLLLLADRARLDAMRAAARRLAQPDAAERIAAGLERLATGGGADG